MLQTKTSYFQLGTTPETLHGLRFRALVSVDQTERPPGGGVAPAIVGPLDSAGYVLDSAAGTIRRADGLSNVWARIVYEWEDAPDQAAVDAAQATADFLAQRPQFAAALAAALARLDTGVGHIQTEAQNIATQATTAPMTTLISGLQAATVTSFAQAQTAIRNVGTVLESMRVAHSLEGQAIRDEAIYLRRTIQVLASSLGIPLGA